MKKKNSKLIWLVLLLVIIFAIMLYFYFKPASDNKTDTSNIREVQVNTGTIEKTITGSRRSIFCINRKIRTKYI